MIGSLLSALGVAILCGSCFCHVSKEKKPLNLGADYYINNDYGSLSSATFMNTYLNGAMWFNSFMIRGLDLQDGVQFRNLSYYSLSGVDSNSTHNSYIYEDYMDDDYDLYHAMQLMRSDDLVLLVVEHYYYDYNNSVWHASFTPYWRVMQMAGENLYYNLNASVMFNTDNIMYEDGSNGVEFTIEMNNGYQYDVENFETYVTADIITSGGSPYDSTINNKYVYFGGNFSFTLLDLTHDLDGNDLYFGSCFYSQYKVDAEFDYSVPYNNGYRDGFNDGSAEGWQNGYIQGLNTGSQASMGVQKLFGVVADTPIRFLKNMFNFELFGMNVAVVILSCLTAVVIFGLVKKIWK